MGFIWFLLGLLIVAFFYFHLARRISHLNLELSEDLKSEILSLIAEFNHTAEKNITVIEERTRLAKVISSEIAQQLNYMKKLKETLEREIKEAELKLRNILSNEKARIQTETLSKSIVAKTYETVQSSFQPSVSSTEESLKSQEEEKEGTISPPNSQAKITEVGQKKGEDISPPKAKQMAEEKKEEVKEPSLRERIFQLRLRGLSVQEIARETNMTGGEVKLILKFFGGES